MAQVTLRGAESIFRGVMDPPRTPVLADLCRCGHSFKTHSGACQYQESVFSDIARSGPTGPKCECREFAFRYLGSGLPEEKRIDKIMTDIARLDETKQGQEIALQDIERIVIAAFKIPAEFVQPVQPPKPMGLKEILTAAEALREDAVANSDLAERGAFVRLKQAVVEQRMVRVNTEAKELDAPRAPRAHDEEEI